MNPAAAHLEDQSVRAARLLLRDRLLHERVCMTAGDEVDAVDLRRDEGIASLIILVVTQMRHANDERAAFFSTQLFHHVACGNGGIDERHSFEVVGSDQCNWTDTKTKQPDAYSTK